MLKRLRIPSNLNFPVLVTEVHVSSGQEVSKGDPLYSLKRADGKIGIMRAPFAGQIVEGPVPLNAYFETSVPVIGIEQVVAAAQDAPTSSEKNHKLKRLRLPKQLKYPVCVTEVHVSMGQSVNKGDPLYSLKGADGRNGMMRAPFSGLILEGPVPVDTHFDGATPVIGIDVRIGAATESQPAPEQPTKPKTQDTTQSSTRRTSNFGETQQQKGDEPKGNQSSPQNPAEAQPSASPEPSVSRKPDEVPCAAQPETKPSPPKNDSKIIFADMMLLAEDAREQAKLCTPAEFRQIIAQGLIHKYGYQQEFVRRHVMDLGLQNFWHRQQKLHEEAEQVAATAPEATSPEPTSAEPTRVESLRGWTGIALIFLIGPITYHYMLGNWIDPHVLRSDLNQLYIFAAAALALALMFVVIFPHNPKYEDNFLGILLIAVGAVLIPLLVAHFTPADFLEDYLRAPEWAGGAPSFDDRPEIRLVDLYALGNGRPPDPTPAQSAALQSFLQGD